MKGEEGHSRSELRCCTSREDLEEPDGLKCCLSRKKSCSFEAFCFYALHEVALLREDEPVYFLKRIPIKQGTP